MTTMAVTKYGPFNVTDATAAGVVETTIEAGTYSATAKWIVVGPNTRGIFWVFQINRGNWLIS